MTNRRSSDIFTGQTGYGRIGPDNMINLAQAGTRQYAINIDNLAGNSAYIRRNVIPFLIEAPRFFRFMDDPEMMVRGLKALVERHTRTITGLNRTVRVTSAEVASGGSGEVWQTPTNVTRDRSNPVFGGFELQGRAITHFIHTWIVWGIGDENSKVPLVATLGDVKSTDYDSSFYGATMLFVEPDPTHTEVVNAILCTNMYPTETPNWEAGMDRGTFGGDQEEYSIPFTATSDVSMGVRILARTKLRELQLAGLDPNGTAILLNDASADVKAASNGIKEQLDEGAGQRISYGS